ncbi:MAG: tyrosine-type recombinase/integrase [Candidatus Odinarchaeota archaeon]
MTEINNQQIIERYLKRFSHSKKSQSTRKYALEYFFRSDNFGYSGHVFSITKRDVIDYFDYLNHLDTIALQTKINKWMIFRSFLQFIMEYYDDVLIVIPRYSTKWKAIHKKPDTNKDVVMTKEEVKTILDYTYYNNYNYYIFFRLLAETGMRIGEFLNLDCEDVNVKKRYIEAEGKTGRKIYYFSESLARHLEIYLKERMSKETDSKALFLSIQKKRYALRTINHYIRNCVIRLDIEKRISCHTFRRTLNTLRKRMGCPKEDRKILLCHKVSDVNFSCYVKLNYYDYIQLYDKWNPYKNILDN